MDSLKTASPTPAVLAKAALRRLAMARLEPTPANYARAWREEGGPDLEATATTAANATGAATAPAGRSAERAVPPRADERAAVQALAARLVPAGDGRDRLGQALLAQRWDDLANLLDAEVPSPAQQAQAWADLIDRCSRHLDRGTRTWPTGRKKDSLKHVLESSRSDPQRLQQRLRQLIAGWEGDAPLPEASAAAAAPGAPDTLAEAAPVAAQAAVPAPVPAADAAALAAPESVHPASADLPPVVHVAPAGSIEATAPAPAATLDLRPSDPLRQAEQVLDAAVQGLQGAWPADAADAAAPAAAAAPKSTATRAHAADLPVRTPVDAPADARAESAPLPHATRPQPAAAHAALRSEADAPAAAAPPQLAVSAWPQVVSALAGTLQAALPPGEARANEVGVRLRVASQGLVQAAGSASVLASELAELQAACDDVRRVMQHRHHLVDQLGGLVEELTDGLVELSEDDGWVEGQCQAMRAQIGVGLSSRGVSAVSQLLASTRSRQQQLRAERGQARDALKQLIHTMLKDIGELGEHTGRFSDSVGRYAQVIGEADSIEGLAGVVREMVEETRTVHGLVSQTTQRLHDEHERASAMAQRVQDLEGQLRQLSLEVSTDQLTQVANRRGLITFFDIERARVEREAVPLAVGILDIDNFKRLNDTMGHQTGDEALKFLSRRVVEMLRPTDTLARYGGEEFVVLLPATPADEAQQVLTRLQRALSVELFMHEGKQSFVTFSAGVTLYRLGEVIETALTRADEALYEAKRTGKNRTCIA